MKRSEINQALKDMERLIEKVGFSLPPFCHFTPEMWHDLPCNFDEIRDAKLGWDITDYGLGNFPAIGFSLITLRNGSPGTGKTYAEKLLMLKRGQMAPMHFHWNKMEDIINRGGGNLFITVYQSDKNEEYSPEDVTLSLDGIRYTVPAGHTFQLKPGESITLTPGVYHDFHCDDDVLIGEVSMTNDDETDNRFKDPIGRFPTIIEDEPPYRLLCTEYP